MSTGRIDATSHERLKRIAREEKISLQAVLERALQSYEETRFFERLNADFAALKSDSVARKSDQAEAAAWEGTLADGWPPEPW